MAAVRWPGRGWLFGAFLLFLTVGHVASGRMSFSFFPPIQADFLVHWVHSAAGATWTQVLMASERRAVCPALPAAWNLTR